MNEKLDPKELKILADILALVLEDEKGQSVNALETIKKRAKKNAITGGALKNLFYSVAQNPPQTGNTSTSRTKKNATASEDLLKARSQIKVLTQDINRLDILVRNLRMQKESLHSELLLTQQSRAEIQAALHITESKASLKTVMIAISFFFGLLIGIMGTITFHSLMAPVPPNNTIYLN